MDQDQRLRLLLRQLKDVQAQADKILTGDNSMEAIENFSRYSGELKAYVLANVPSRDIHTYVSDIPEIDYSGTSIGLWHYLLFPVWWVMLYKDYKARQEATEEVNIVKGKYATLEVMLRGLES